MITAQQGDAKKAHELAIAAAPQLPPEASGRLAVELLALFAAARQHAIIDAVRNKQDWPPEWMSDVHTTYGLLAQHPLGSDQHVVDHYDFLLFFSAPDTDAVLDRGLVRFAASPSLHQRLRTRLLERGGPAGLEAEYEKRAAAADAAPALPWFAGYASLVAAEAHRRKNAAADATAAYERAIVWYGKYHEATGNADGAHFVAMAHGGIARVRLGAGDLAGTFAALQQTFAAAPAAAAAVDGLGITAMQTAEMLRARASEAKDEALVQQLDAALKALPPEAFELPEYERASRGQNPGRRRRG